MVQGTFYTSNSYALRDFVPWTVSFVVSGDLLGRTSPFFDSTKEVSIELATEWWDFHVRQGRYPLVTVHFPLSGEDLIQAMDRLGWASRALAIGTAAYLSRVKSALPFIQACFVPIAFLQAVEEEIIKGAAQSLEDETARPLSKVAHGAWLEPQPQSPWSRKHTALGSKEPPSYLWFASVYGGDVDDLQRQWARSVELEGPKPTMGHAPRVRISSVEEWARMIEASSGLEILPVIDATLGDEASWNLADRLKGSSGRPPVGIIRIPERDDGGDFEVTEWWTLSQGPRSTLKLEGSGDREGLGVAPWISS